MTIKLDDNRLRYTNEKLDITIIEIKENDHNLNIKYFELDDGIIKLLYINNSDITHNCNIKEGSSGSPILLLNNQKIIGIHFGSSKQNKYNKGRLLIYYI